MPIKTDGHRWSFGEHAGQYLEVQVFDILVAVAMALDICGTTWNLSKKTSAVGQAILSALRKSPSRFREISS